jgi:hypothetical protein
MKLVQTDHVRLYISLVAQLAEFSAIPDPMIGGCRSRLLLPLLPLLSTTSGGGAHCVTGLAATGTVPAVLVYTRLLAGLLS